MNKRCILILLIMLLMLSTAGCWGQHELNELGFVMATGVDFKDGMYRVTVLTSIPAAGAMQQTDRSSMWIGTAEGKTISTAAKNLTSKSPKKLSWIQNSILVFGEGAARHGLDELLDYFIRSMENRFDASILVSEGSAADILTTPSDISKNLYQELEGLILYSKDWSKAFVPDLREFAIVYNSKSCDSVAGRIIRIPNNMISFSTSREAMQQVEPATGLLDEIELVGAAAFSNGKLVGWLDGTETRGFLWIEDKITTGTIELTSEDSKDVSSIEIISSRTQIKTEVIDGELHINIKVDAKGRILEHTGSLDFLDKESMEALDRSFAEEIKKEMEKVVKKAQKEYKADIFGWGNTIYRKEPQLWRQIEEDWEELFPEIKVSYEVKVLHGRSGEILDKVTGREKK